MENLCNECKRICRARNESREIAVLSCDAFIYEFKGDIHRTEIQTRITDLGFV